MKIACTVYYFYMKRGYDLGWEEGENKVQKLDVEVMLHGHLPHICWMADNWFQARFLLGTVCKSWYQLLKITAFPVQEMNTRLIEKLIEVAKEGQSWNLGVPKDWPITLCIQVVIALKRLELMNIRPTMACFSKYDIEKRTDAIFQRLNLQLYKPHYKPEALAFPIYDVIGIEFYTDTHILAVSELKHFKLPKMHFKVIRDNNVVEEPIVEGSEKMQTEKNVRVFKMFHIDSLFLNNCYEYPSYTNIVPTQLDNTTKTIIGTTHSLCGIKRRYGFDLHCIITPMMTQPEIKFELCDLEVYHLWRLFIFVHRFPSHQPIRVPESPENICKEMEEVCEKYQTEKRFTIQGNEINFFCN